MFFSCQCFRRFSNVNQLKLRTFQALFRTFFEQSRIIFKLEVPSFSVNFQHICNSSELGPIT